MSDLSLSILLRYWILTKRNIFVIERVHCHTTRLVLELREISYNETYTSIFGKPQVKRWYNNSLQVPEWFWQCGLWVVLWKSGIHCLRSPYEDKEKNSIMWHQEFFSVRVVDKWNSLEEDVLEVKSIHSFKSRYDLVSI